MRARYLYLIALVLAVLDQLTKYLVQSYVPADSTTPILGQFVFLTMVHNRGGAFGMLQSWTGVLTLVTVVVVVAIVVLSHRKKSMPPFIAFALALELGGAVGNLIDRVRLGYVIDFVDLRIWPVFNLADCAITVGLVLLAYYLIVVEGRHSRAESSPTNRIAEE